MTTKYDFSTARRTPLHRYSKECPEISIYIWATQGNRKLPFFPPISKELAFSWAVDVYAKTRFWSHIHFIGRCLHSKVIPKGFRSNFHAFSFSHSNQYRHQIQCAQNSFSRNIMRITIRAMCQKRNKLTEQILHCRSELSKICPAVLVQSIRAKIQDANSKLFKHLHQIKAQKLDQLIGPQVTNDSSPQNLKTVVTISENLLLSDSEKSAVGKGLNFVPKSKKLTNFQLSKTLKNSFVAFNWKPFNKEDDSKISNKDTFETLQIRKSKWLPQRASSHL